MLLLLGVFFFVTALATQDVRSFYHSRPLCENARYGEACFHFEPRLASFVDAEIVCRSKGGHLASIRNDYENQIIARKAYVWSHQVIKTNVFWIGGVWSWGWGWVDGQPMHYQHFANPEDLHHPPYSCLSLVISNAWNLNGLWLPTFCNGLAPFVCEVTKGAVFPPTLPPTPRPKPTTTTTQVPETTTTTTPTTTSTSTTTTSTPPTTTTTTAEPNSCEGQHQPCFNNHIYLINIRNLTWSKAEEYCISRNGHLASILSSEETDFVAYLIDGANLGFDVWLGAHRFHNTFIWLDGSKWEYTNFLEEQPNGLKQNNCLEIFDANHKKWVNYDCQREYPSICKIPA
ncbi:hypothetical protein QR680_006021 [Steinernema hermaphroditum]|uniref:C-type lectin domain-containing protein n=1 Tax=Steinernema hermaphroditum TaxID=289476 RepID=A0AA39HU04_9BILA|nr:hypothetical protein QR680_006021 [Steinernema hermaphroditum]